MDALQKFIIDVLDDEDGITERAFDSLCELNKDGSIQHILDLVDASEGKFFLDEEDAEQLRKK